MKTIKLARKTDGPLLKTVKECAGQSSIDYSIIRDHDERRAGMEGIAHVDGTYTEKRRFRKADDDGSDHGGDDAHHEEAGGRRRATYTTRVRARRDKCSLAVGHRTEAVR